MLQVPQDKWGAVKIHGGKENRFYVIPLVQDGFFQEIDFENLFPGAARGNQYREDLPMDSYAVCSHKYAASFSLQARSRPHWYARSWRTA